MVSNINIPLLPIQLIIKASDSIKFLTLFVICFSIPLFIILLRDKFEEQEDEDEDEDDEFYYYLRKNKKYHINIDIH